MLTLLEDLCDIGYRMQCGNVSDRIYSVVSLCDDGSKSEVNYNLNPAELAVNMLMTYKEFLCICSLKLLTDVL